MPVVFPSHNHPSARPVAHLNAIMAGLKASGVAINIEPLAVRAPSGAVSSSLPRAALLDPTGTGATPGTGCIGCGGISCHRYSEEDDEKTSDAAVTSG